MDAACEYYRTIATTRRLTPPAPTEQKSRVMLATVLIDPPTTLFGGAILTLISSDNRAKRPHACVA